MTQVHEDSGTPLEAQFDLEIADRVFSVILHSSGGKTRSGGARNADYARGLQLILERLGRLRATLINAYVDSQPKEDLPLDKRRLSRDLSYPVHLADVQDFDVLRTRLTEALRDVGGSNRSRFRMQLDIPGFPPVDDSIDQLVPVLAGTNGASEGHNMRNYGAATETRISQVVDTCERYGSSSIVALAGVPGTGKSYVARIAAQRIAGDPLRVREIQFHPSTTYEEFIEGLRIDSSGAITVMPGLFTEWNDLALDDRNSTWVLLIEELTRANVSAVLGELMTFVEDRSRPFTTVYSRRPVKVAENLIILSTYNPTDRSALEVDSALLRRLRVLDFSPDVGQLRDMLQHNGIPNILIDRLRNVFEAVRTAHPDDYGLMMPFGHGIFAEVRQEKPDLYELWDSRMRHMLQRPLMPPHPYYDLIRSNYPWTSEDFEVGE